MTKFDTDHLKVPLVLPPSPLSTCSQASNSPISHARLIASSVNLVTSIRQRLDDCISVPEASTIIADKKCASLWEYYATLIPQDKAEFLRILSTDYNVDSSRVQKYAASVGSCKDRGHAWSLRAQERLRQALVPQYQHLFTQISHQEGGVKFLVDLRADVINLLTSAGPEQGNSFLQSMGSCLRDLLSLWFSVGFLRLERITWESPCDMLQKISEYEAVHPIRNWADLKRRVGPNRRCFVFTHNSMPREPVVVLHTALTDNISNSIQKIVSSPSMNIGFSSESDLLQESEKNSSESITTSIFYSITSTQKGLQGVEMGNYLIKNVVQELLAEFPDMQKFSSLSPIPGFKDWLVTELNKYLHQKEAGEDPVQTLFLKEEMQQLYYLYAPDKNVHIFQILKKNLETNSWFRSKELTKAFEEPFMRLCARYLFVEKRRGFALNPVANFHLRNGAVMWRLNWLADVSPRGLGASCGMMVNYRYFLADTETNSKNYMEQQVIAASKQILDLVKESP